VHAVALKATAPPPQVVQALPAEAAYSPAEQAAQEAGGKLALPAGHSEAAPHDVAPAGLNAPATHALHATAPGAAAEVPGAQGAHATAPAMGALEPAAHGAQLVAPTMPWARPAGHGEQEDALAKRPGAHHTHAAPDAMLPAGHAEALATHTAPLGWLSWPAPQGAQRFAAPSPTTEEKLPGGHVRHVAAEVAFSSSL
jgi:hypothetical protein